MWEAHPDLDLSMVKLKDPAVALENIEELFGDTALGDGELAQNIQVQSVVDEAHQPANIIE